MRKLWTDDAWDDYLYWQNTDKKAVKKINTLLRDIERAYKAGESMLNGIGSPEFLKGDLSGLLSRTIDEKHRLIYNIENGILQIFSCHGHYDDK